MTLDISSVTSLFFLKQWATAWIRTGDLSCCCCSLPRPSTWPTSEGAGALAPHSSATSRQRRRTERRTWPWTSTSRPADRLVVEDRTWDGLVRVETIWCARWKEVLKKCPLKNKIKQLLSKPFKWENLHYKVQRIWTSLTY